MTPSVSIDAGISMLSGAMFNYDDPGASEVAIEDLANNLSNVCRFAGAVRYFYSVAQHAVNCSHIVPPEFAFDALMHDTAEGLMNDIPTPLKHRVPSFKELEIKIETELARQFNFAFPLPDAVKIADTQMLILENTELRPGCALSGIDIDAFDLTGLHGLVDLSPWPPELAKHRFLTRYEELSR